MADTDFKPSLCLDKDLLINLPDPDYELVIKYKSKTLNSAGKSKISWEGTGDGVTRPPKTLREICNKLISVLSNIKGMSEFETRSYLLRGFSQSELVGLQRHPGNMSVDLGNIVDHIVTYLEKLDSLIENANDLNLNQKLKSKLEETRADYNYFIRKSKSENDSFPPKNY